MSCTQSFYEVFGPSLKAAAKYHTFRIPAVVYFDGYILAFCEGRKNSSNDYGPMDMLLRRGRVRDQYRIEWDEEPIVVASINGQRTMNPCPVVDEASGTVSLVFNTFKEDVPEGDFKKGNKYDETLYVTTTSRSERSVIGSTWTQMVNITEDILGHMDPPPLVYAPGPGHGIQIQGEKHKGRLIIAGHGFWREPKCCGSTKVNKSLFIMSDDNGTSWTCGDYITDHAHESQVAELENGMLYVNSRNNAKLRRKEAFMSDGGQILLGERTSKLKEPKRGCEGSVLSFEPTDRLKSPHTAKRWVLFSNPANKCIRKNLSVRLSKDNCMTWTKPYTLWSGLSAYSDLVSFQCEGEIVFGCLHECGEGLKPSRKIVFQTFKIDKLLNIKSDF